MMLFDEVLKDIEQKRERKQKGLFNGIPFPFEKYREYVDSIDKGMYYGLLGGTGTGKSRFMRHILYSMVEFSLANDYPVKVLYFALEDAKQQVFKKIIGHYLWTFHKIDLSQRYLDSKDKPLDGKYIEIMRKEGEFFRKFEKTVWIINDATSPNEIAQRCRKVQKEYGATHHIVVIIDNYSNITMDAHHNSEWHAVRELSRNIIRLELCKQYGMSVFGVMQTDFDTEKNSFRSAGKYGLAAVEPNMGSIGDAKVIARDMFTIFALFNPWRYDIKAYPTSEGYNIDVLRDRFRSLIMLKNNEGEMAPRLGMYFDGKHERYDEMPLTTEKERLEFLYNKILQEEREKRERFAKSTLF